MIILNCCGNLLFGIVKYDAGTRVDHFNLTHYYAAYKLKYSGRIPSSAAHVMKLSFDVEIYLLNMDILSHLYLRIRKLVDKIMDKRRQQFISRSIHIDCFDDIFFLAPFNRCSRLFSVLHLKRF